MRVLHVGLETLDARAGGLNRYFEELVRAEAECGIDVVGVALGAVPCEPGATPGETGTTPGETGAALGGRGALFAVAPRGGGLRRAFAVARAVRGLDPPFDLADVHFAGTSFVAALSSLRMVPKVVHFQGPWADESAHAGAKAGNVLVKRAVERAVYRRAARLVVLSGAFGSLLVERYGVAPWRVAVIPPGVDLERYGPGDAGAARDRLGVGSRRVVLAVRRLIPRMGLEVLLDAWGQVRRAPEDLLVVVGDGPLRGALEAQVAARGLGGAVRLVGRVGDAELAHWYRAAHVTVVPTVALEGFGLVVLESAASGTPVVATDAAGLPEALAVLGAGPPVPAGDAGALAAALEARLAAPVTDAERAELRRAAEHVGWDRIARRHLALYEGVLDRAEARSVVVLDHTSVLSGGELAIARALGGLGTQVHAHAILATDGPLRSRLEGAGATVEVLELSEGARNVPRTSVRPGSLSPRAVAQAALYVLGLARRLRVLRPDVVHANSLKAGLYGCAAARLARVPCVWHVRDHVEAPYLPRSAVRLVRLATRVLPDVVVANSASTLATLRPRRGLVVPSPLDPSVVGVRRRAPRDEALRVTVLGRLAPWKGQDLALRAFAKAFPIDGATLRIVGAALFGEDTYADSLPALAASLGVASRVSFEGFVEDVADVLAATDVLVHSSTLPEPFGQTVLEGMGAGCAVVVADRGGPRELVTDGVDGLHYPMGDADALSACLSSLGADPSLRARLASAALSTARAYTPEALAPRLLDAWALAAVTRHRG